MINPEDIDFNSLPWLPLEEKSAFPKRPSIYFAIDSLGNVQYIGRAVNVKKRWVQHHKYDELSNIGGIKIAYLFVDTPELLPEIERALIQWFQPPLNFIDNPSRKVTRTRSTRDIGTIAGMKARNPIKARDAGIVSLRVFVTPKERDLIQQACKENGFTMAHALRILGLDWAEGQIND